MQHLSCMLYINFLRLIWAFKIYIRSHKNLSTSFYCQAFTINTTKESKKQKQQPKINFHLVQGFYFSSHPAWGYYADKSTGNAVYSLHKPYNIMFNNYRSTDNEYFIMWEAALGKHGIILDQSQIAVNSFTSWYFLNNNCNQSSSPPNQFSNLAPSKDFFW